VRTMASLKPVAGGSGRLSAVMLTSMKSLITGAIGRLQSSQVSTGKRLGSNYGSEGWGFESLRARWNVLVTRSQPSSQ
jgi:hypothetical protein